jgi:hypothetical protein
LLVCYWLFVWQMERIDLEGYQFPFPIAITLPQFVVSFMTLFLPRVLRHFLPILLGFLLAYEMASNVLFYLYDLQDHSDARRFLNRLRNPGRFGGKAVTVTPQTLEKQRRESARLRAGGPGRVNIPVGHVAITELNGRYFRTIVGGSHILNSFEYVKAVLDLRPQERNNFKVRLQSREGLEVTTNASVTFRIGTGGAPATPRQPYPFDADAVRKLAYAEINLPEGRVANWEGSALGTVVGTLGKIVATFSIDELLQDSQTEIGSHLTIRRQVEREARAKLKDQGIDLQRVRIGRFRFPEDVTSQHLEYWSTYWDTQAELARVDGEAVAIEGMEIARAAAEMEMIQAIVAGVQQAKQQGYGGTESVVVALRLIEALEKLARQSQTDVSLPDEMLPQLQSLHQQLLLSSSLSEENEMTPPAIISPDEEAPA